MTSWHVAPRILLLCIAAATCLIVLFNISIFNGMKASISSSTLDQLLFERALALENGINMDQGIQTDRDSAKMTFGSTTLPSDTPEEDIEDEYPSNPLPKVHKFSLSHKKDIQQDQGLLPNFRAQNRPVRHRAKILIATLARSGSSFVGNLFNNHRDVLYYFEPLHSAYVLQKREEPYVFSDFVSHNEEITDYFHALLDCKLQPKHSRFLTQFSKFGDRTRTKAFYSSPLCFRNTASDCRSVPLLADAVNKECEETYSHVVIKELQARLPLSIEGFHKAIYDSPKIIQLTRDPRAIFLSYMKLGFLKEVRTNTSLLQDTVKRLCQTLTDNLEYGLRVLEPMGLYKVFRYEDICTDFQSQLSQMFSFAGLPMYTDYMKFLDEIEHLDEISQKDRVNPYSVKRVLTTRVSGWRTTMDISYSVMIEEQCGDVMQVLGYKLIGNDKELLQNLEVPLYQEKTRFRQ